MTHVIKDLFFYPWERARINFDKARFPRESHSLKNILERITRLFLAVIEAIAFGPNFFVAAFEGKFIFNDRKKEVLKPCPIASERTTKTATISPLSESSPSKELVPISIEALVPTQTFETRRIILPQAVSKQINSHNISSTMALVASIAAIVLSGFGLWYFRVGTETFHPESIIQYSRAQNEETGYDNEVANANLANNGSSIFNEAFSIIEEMPPLIALSISAGIIIIGSASIVSDYTTNVSALSTDLVVPDSSDKQSEKSKLRLETQGHDEVIERKDTLNLGSIESEALNIDIQSQKPQLPIEVDDEEAKVQNEQQNLESLELDEPESEKEYRQKFYLDNENASDEMSMPVDLDLYKSS